MKKYVNKKEITGLSQMLNGFNFVAGLLIFVILTGCGATNMDSRTYKERELSQYRKQLSDIKVKISMLEEELDVKKEVEITNVGVEKVSAREFSHIVEVTGNVEAEEDVDVSPETSGNIVSVNVVEGEWANKGAVLAKLNTEAIERNIEDMKIQYELLKIMYEKQKNLWEQKIGSEVEFLTAQSSMESMKLKIEGLEARLKLAVITSPVAGIVDRIYQNVGEMAMPQKPVAKVVNISKVRIYADVSERYLNAIKAGDKVKIEFPAIDKVVNARVYRKSNIINPDNRTFRMRINLDNRDGEIKPNLVSIIHVTDYYNPEAIVVPSILIKNDFKGKYLYVAKNNSDRWVAEKYYVETGVSDNNYTSLKTGLKPGELLIVKGYNQVADGSEIDINK